MRNFEESKVRENIGWKILILILAALLILGFIRHLGHIIYKQRFKRMREIQANKPLSMQEHHARRYYHR